MQRMDAAIGKLRRDTRLRRIITPAHPWIVRVSGISVVAMGKFRIDQTNFSQIAACDHRFHVPHE